MFCCWLCFDCDFQLYLNGNISFDECVSYCQREGQVEAGVLTTSTHSGEEKEEERKRVSVSSSAIFRDPEPRALISHSGSFPGDPLPSPAWYRGSFKQWPSCLSFNQCNILSLTFFRLLLPMWDVPTIPKLANSSQFWTSIMWYSLLVSCKMCSFITEAVVCFGFYSSAKMRKWVSVNATHQYVSYKSAFIKSNCYRCEAGSLARCICLKI